MSRIRFGSVLAAGVILIGSSCAPERSRRPEIKRQAPAAPTESTTGSSPAGDPAAVATAADYTYNSISKRDPFRSSLSESMESEVDGNLTPLQRYGLDQLKLTGILWGTANPKALLVDPTGLAHFAERGTLIGQNWGRVSRIGPAELVVTEEYRDPQGKLVVNDVRMVLEQQN